MNVLSLLHRNKVNAMKETPFRKGNRKAASPTESAAGGN